MAKMKNFIYRPRCELCGSDEKRILLSREFSYPSIWEFINAYYERRINKDDLADGQYEIAKCSKCGFIWQTYILNDERMEKLYSVWISSDQSLNKKRHAGITLYANYATDVAKISILLNKKPSEINVLDFGMGWGYWCLMAKAFGYNVSGFEVSKERINYARRNGIETVGWAEISADNFDFINAEQVFEHVPEPLKTLRSIAGSLKKGGYIRIAVPDGGKIESELTNPEWRASKNAIHPLEHINCFTRKMLVLLGEWANLQLKLPVLLGRSPTLYLTGSLGKYYHHFSKSNRCYFMRKD